MEKRAILAIAVTFLIIVAWSMLQPKFFPQTTAPVKESKKEEVGPSHKEVEKKISIKEEKPLRESKTVPRAQMIPKKEVLVETQNFLAVFTSEDARLKHFRLKKYEDRVKESWITISLTHAVSSLLGKKEEAEKTPKPLDLVGTTEEEGLPLGITFVGVGPSGSEGNWEVDKDEIRLLQDGEKGEISFVRTLENGLKVLKRYRFSSELYVIDLDVEVQNSSSKEVTGQLGLEWIGKVELAKLVDEGNKDFGLRYALLKDNKVERKEFGAAGGAGCSPMSCGPQKKTIDAFELSEKGNIRWFSFGGEYFSALMIPPDSSREVSLSIKGSEKNILRADLIAPQFSLSPENTTKIRFRVYMGPKDEEGLRMLGVDAEKLVNFGYFTIVAKPLLWFLRLTHHVTRNFGMDIIIISILIKILFLPLTQISMKSMKEMQKVQPEMNRLKETCKNDKARLQQEIMLLYKRRKINPMSGCLPMLIQIPVFIALYNALQNAIEMRHAPFFLWIRDLAAKDPIYVTPIIMGASMVLQQKMTPSTADPAQAKMMLLMPVMFTFLFLNFPAGLVLYWMVNNILSIAHQYYMNKKV